jgi:hypothetical protein
MASITYQNQAVCRERACGDRVVSLSRGPNWWHIYRNLFYILIEVCLALRWRNPPTVEASGTGIVLFSSRRWVIFLKVIASQNSSLLEKTGELINGSMEGIFLKADAWLIQELNN